MPINQDSAQKEIFSHKQVVIDFLRDYVRQPWVRSMDFDSLEKVNSSYVHEIEQQRIGDIVWRLKLKDGGGWVYMYLLLELQSSVDRYMALRMMVYVGLLYQDLIKQKNLGTDGLLPPIFPAVIYNGKRPWSAALSLSELITPVPEQMRMWLPNINYFVLDEGRVQPLASDNILSSIIQMERAPDTEQLFVALQRANKLLKAPEHQTLRRSLLAWLKRVVLRRVIRNREFSNIHELQELYTMLAETVTQWTRDWKHEGWQKGLQEGREEGLQEGRQEGLQEGRREGRQEGRQEGLQEGRREGRREGSQKAAIALSHRGFSVAEIADALELDESEVKQMLT